MEKRRVDWVPNLQKGFIGRGLCVFRPQGKSNGGGGHKGRWDPTDDGSEAQAVDGIADEGDPNYDPSADDHDNNYVLVRSVVVLSLL